MQQGGEGGLEAARGKGRKEFQTTGRGHAATDRTNPPNTTTMSEGIHDPENYRKMAESFASLEEANAALDAFFADVRAARQKHRIADVLTVTMFTVRYADGEEGAALSRSHNGDVLKAESMAAYALGREQEHRREAINKLVAGRATQKTPR